MRVRLDQIVIDARAPAQLVRFWSALAGGIPVDRARGWSHVEPPGLPRLSFQPVPEERAGKNRLHLDLLVDDIAAAVEVAVALGATVSGGSVTDESGAFQVLGDPEGNEFCFVTNPPTGAPITRHGHATAQARVSPPPAART